jgi:hypothetical protein
LEGWKVNARIYVLMMMTMKVDQVEIDAGDARMELVQDKPVCS